MNKLLQISTLDQLAMSFFKASEGQWNSQRRYYTLKSSKTEEVVSQLTIRLLEAGCDELAELERLHGLAPGVQMTCGTEVIWESHYEGPVRKPLTGSTVFGTLDGLLYRDRGFATPKPVVARYEFRDDNTMRLFTEYNNSSFEEEIKLVGEQYRTRQTIISRAGKEQMIGQYLETRV